MPPGNPYGYLPMAGQGQRVRNQFPGIPPKVQGAPGSMPPFPDPAPETAPAPAAGVVTAEPFPGQPGSGPRTINATPLPGGDPFPGPPGSGPKGAVTGEKILAQVYAKGGGPTPIGKGGNYPGQEQGSYPAQAPQQLPPGYMPEVWNGATRWGGPPSLNSFVAANVPMMPPAYADVEMEARNNAIQANARGEATSQWTRAMQDYTQMNTQAALQGGELALRRDLGMGGLGLQQRQLDQAQTNSAFDRMMREKVFGAEERKQGFEERKFEQGRSMSEQEKAMYAFLIANGKTDADARAAVEQFRAMFGAVAAPTGTPGPFPGPASPADAPGSAKGPPMTGVNPAPAGAPFPGPVSRQNVYAPFESEFDKIAGYTPGAPGQPSAPAASVGTFLNKLDAAKPQNFTAQNRPAIEAYVKSRWGENAYRAAGAPPQTVDYYDMLSLLPAASNLSRWAGGKLGMSEPTNLSDNPWYAWLGGIGAGGIAPVLLKLGAGDTVLPGMQPTDDALGRAKLPNLLRGR